MKKHVLYLPVFLILFLNCTVLAMKRKSSRDLNRWAKRSCCVETDVVACLQQPLLKRQNAFYAFNTSTRYCAISKFLERCLGVKDPKEIAVMTLYWLLDADEVELLTTIYKQFNYTVGFVLDQKFLSFCKFLNSRKLMKFEETLIS